MFIKLFILFIIITFNKTFKIMKTTEELVEAYLIRQKWQTENYPNIEQNENK